MSRPLVVWDPRMLGYDFGGHHPMRPLRCELTWLARDLGVVDGFEVFAPNPADARTLGLVHTAGYISAVRSASGPDSSWLRAFHAVVPGVLRAFRPEVLVTQHGADSHREDPLADLNLTVDGHRTSYEALRELAETVTGGRWLALGGGGYSPVRVVPRSWTHLLAIVSGHDLDPATALPREWLARAAAVGPGIPLPVDMSDGVPNPVTFQPWDGTVEMAVDRAILDTRSIVYPVHGLDADEPCD